LRGKRLNLQLQVEPLNFLAKFLIALKNEVATSAELWDFNKSFLAHNIEI